MACSLYTGITKSDQSCDGTFGGITGLWLIDKSSITAVRIRTIDGVITGVTASGDFFPFEFEDEVGASFAESKPDAQQFVTQTIVSTYQNVDTDKRNVFSIFRRGRFAGIALKPNGTYWLVGRDKDTSGFGLRGAVEMTTGQAATDIAQATLTLSATTIDFAREITSAAALTLIS